MPPSDGFREDFIIANDDGYLYHLTQRDLKEGTNAHGKPFRIDPSDRNFAAQYGDVMDMLSHGLTMGAVPTVPDDERSDVTLVVPVTCYVMNIDALKHYNRWEPWHERKETSSDPEHRRVARRRQRTDDSGGAEAGA